MKTRYTHKSLEADLAALNARLEAAKSDWRLIYGSRNGYSAVDLATVEQAARHCCQKMLVGGSPRECLAEAQAFVIGETTTRPEPRKFEIHTMADVRMANAANGMHWFDAGTMKSFRCRIESAILRRKYFVTSEQFDDQSPRLYTLRSFDAFGSIDTVGEFQAHATKADAVAAIPDGKGVLQAA